MRHDNEIGLIFSAVVGAFVAGVHTAFGYNLANPRMVTQPWLIRQGFVPYVHLADQKMPL